MAAALETFRLSAFGAGAWLLQAAMAAASRAMDTGLNMDFTDIKLPPQDEWQESLAAPGDEMMTFA